MTAKQNPRGGHPGAQGANHDAEAIVPDAADNTESPRPRCCACGHTLTAEESVRRGFGPTCYGRLCAAQRVERTELVRGRLDALSGYLDALDGVGLDLLAVTLDDLEDALGLGAGVTS